PGKADLARRRVNWRAWISAFLLLLGAGVLILSQARKPVPKVMILPFQEPTHGRIRVLVDEGLSWLKTHLGGPRRTVVVNTTIIDFKGGTAWSNLPPLKAEYSDTNGLQVWILTDGDLRRLSKTIRDSEATEVIDSPAITTSSGSQSGIS